MPFSLSIRMIVDTPQLDPVRGLSHIWPAYSCSISSRDTPQLDPVRGLSRELRGELVELAVATHRSWTRLGD